MAFVKKYNTYVFIALVAVLVIADVIVWNSLSLTRKLITAFAVAAAMHEIEEKVWPGGFYELMLKKFGMKKEEVDIDRGTLVVSIYWIVILGAAYIFDSQVFLLAIIITLSFFEAFIHTVGIKIHRLTKPYTPGLVTAWCMAAVGVVAVITLNRTGMAAAKDYVLGAVFWLLSFVCMDIVIISGFGKSFSDLINSVRKQR
jgi:hypothetical protein